MSTVNKVTLVGNCGRDAEVKTFQNGGKIAVFSIATSDGYKGKDGNWVDRTEWHNIKVENEHLIELCERAVKKGVKVYVDGKIQSREHEGKRYTEIVVGRFKGEVVVLDKREQSDGGYSAPKQSAPAFDDFADDSDIPF